MQLEENSRQQNTVIDKIRDKVEPEQVRGRITDDQKRINKEFNLRTGS